MIGGRGGRKIEALSPQEWLERRYRELRGLPRDSDGRIRSLGKRVRVSEDQLEIKEPDPV